MRGLAPSQKKQRHRLLYGLVPFIPLFCIFFLSTFFSYFLWDFKTQKVYQYWIAARVAKPFDAATIGKELERQCDCHLYLQVRAERFDENHSRVDILFYIKSTRRFRLRQGTISILSAQSVEWEQNTPRKCFKNSFFNPACESVQNHSDAATVNNGTIVNDNTTDVVFQDRKLIYTGLDAQKSPVCAEKYHEEILLFFVLIDNILNSDTWSVSEFGMHAGCYNTGFDDVQKTRAYPYVFRDQVCQGFPSALLTVTITEDNSFNILLSAESLTLPMTNALE